MGFNRTPRGMYMERRERYWDVSDGQVDHFVGCVCGIFGNTLRKRHFIFTSFFQKVQLILDSNNIYCYLVLIPIVRSNNIGLVDKLCQIINVRYYEILFLFFSK